MDYQNKEHAALIELNSRFGTAERSRDDKFMREILFDGLVFRRANGKVTDKATYLADLVNSENTYDRLTVDDIQAHLFEDLAVVTLCVDAAGMREKKSFSGRYRNVRIFVKDNTTPHGWSCHMWFNTKIDN